MLLGFIRAAQDHAGYLPSTLLVRDPVDDHSFQVDYFTSLIGIALKVPLIG